MQVDIAYPIGTSSQEAQLARARLQQTQAERQISSLELAVTTQVRDAARNVQTNAKRVDATRSSRVLAERRLEAEEKKYQAGMTQNFFVLTGAARSDRRAQQRAARARRVREVGRELRAPSSRRRSSANNGFRLRLQPARTELMADS